MLAASASEWQRVGPRAGVLVLERGRQGQMEKHKTSRGCRRGTRSVGGVCQAGVRSVIHRGVGVGWRAQAQALAWGWEGQGELRKHRGSEVEARRAGRRGGNQRE